ncbi:MAG TPA: alkaline phosphatase family protein [Rhizomicrobium sp.]
MKRPGYLLIAWAIFAALPAQAQITAFKHIVIIVQENRTPDNLFAAMCQQLGGSATCDPTDNTKYDILTDGWKNGSQGTVTPVPVDLGIGWDIEHHHLPDWVNMCDQHGTACRMDGAANENCKGGSCPTNYPPEFSYVQRYTAGADVLGPYINLALTYGWANLMFQTNQGPSFPAHQFIYGATSAPSTSDDGSGTYAAENLAGTPNGCLADQGTAVALITNGVEAAGNYQYPCFQHQTLGTLGGSPTAPTWRYYTPGEGSLWTAPTAILSECGVSNQNGGNNKACTGPEFSNHNVFDDPTQVLKDIGNCQLRNVSWVIPKGQYSDHAGIDTDEGPQWVASIVNTLGASQCTDSGKTYWQDTAIVITWDDWGGWYDHEPPPLNQPLGYQLGFRVPLLFVSAYGPNNTNGKCIGYIEGSGTKVGEVLDFGSIANFIEGNFLGSEGLLGFADARAVQRGQQNNWPEDLSDFYNLNQQACTFLPIPTQIDAQYFIDDTSPVQPPDDE